MVDKVPKGSARAVDDGYLEINRRALDTLLRQQASGKGPSHGDASLLLRMLAWSGWQPGREGLFLAGQSEAARLLGVGSTPVFVRAVGRLCDAGFLVELRAGGKPVGYLFPHDVYDWLTHPSRPDLPARIDQPNPHAEGPR